MRKLEGKLLSFLGEVSKHLTCSDIEDARSFIKHGEYGVAFELICDQLHENDSILTDENLKFAELLAEIMKLEEDSWVFLK